MIGAFFGTEIAITIAEGFVDPVLSTNHVILVALLSGIIWNLITWRLGIPSSSSHALIGGLLGAVGIHAGFDKINYATLLHKVIIPMLLSPLCGFLLASCMVIVINRTLSFTTYPRKWSNRMRDAQIVSTSLLSFSHGSNDSQKTMGIITLLLFHDHIISKCVVQDWVILLCAVFMALGTFCGGIRIIKTLSTRVVKLKPENGFAAEISSALLLFIASCLGAPLSTTHSLSGSIMGAGSFTTYGVNWSIVKSIAVAWVFTIPCTMLLASTIYKIMLLIM